MRGIFTAWAVLGVAVYAVLFAILASHGVDHAAIHAAWMIAAAAAGSMIFLVCLLF